MRQPVEYILNPFTPDIHIPINNSPVKELPLHALEWKIGIIHLMYQVPSELMHILRLKVTASLVPGFSRSRVIA